MIWLNLLGMAFKTGASIYENKQKAKKAMSDAQLLHAERMAKGEIEYQGQLLEARQSDWKDEFILILLSLPIGLLAWAVFSDDPAVMEKMKYFFNTLVTFHFGIKPYSWE